MKRKKSPDIVGLIIVNMNCSILVVSLLLPIAAVALNIDPMYYLLPCNEGLATRICLILVRYGICQWAALEGTRIYSVFLTFHVCNAACNMRIVTRIMSENCLPKALDLYTKLQLVIVSGRRAFSLYNAILVMDGCIMMILLNYLILKCYYIMPFAIYVNSVFLDIVIALVIHQTLPLAVNQYESTKDICTYKWQDDVLKMRTKTTSLSLKELRKTIKCQRPVAFYYGIAVFEMSTKQNIYRNILDQTISLLMM